MATKYWYVIAALVVYMMMGKKKKRRTGSRTRKKMKALRIANSRLRRRAMRPRRMYVRR